MNRIVHIGDRAVIPLSWFFTATGILVGLIVPPVLAYASLKHRVGNNTQRIVQMERDSRYAAEDAAWVRGHFDKGFSNVQRERRQREVHERFLGNRADDE